MIIGTLLDSTKAILDLDLAHGNVRHHASCRTNLSDKEPDSHDQSIRKSASLTDEQSENRRELSKSEKINRATLKPPS
jgi:hypothetical protein